MGAGGKKMKGRFRKHRRQIPEWQEGREKGLVFIEDITTCYSKH